MSGLNIGNSPPVLTIPVPVLVLGLCFFAGGLRFSEQLFDASESCLFSFVLHDSQSPSAANQVHSSLLSISVGVLLLPVAYHFALSGNKNDDVPENQRLSILNMSHAVCSTCGN